MRRSDAVIVLIFELQIATLRGELVQIATGQIGAHPRELAVDYRQRLDELLVGRKAIACFLAQVERHACIAVDQLGELHAQQ